MEAKITRFTVITSELLKELCNKYHDEICRGVKPNYLPKIRIRYVEDRAKFGYADFGDFIFVYDDLYVWRSEDKYADKHNSDVIDDEFEGKCMRPEYACRFLYAGADTNFVDSNGEHIFVGDVLQVNGAYETQLALSYFPPFDENEKKYCFVLDNHYLSLEECLRQGVSISRIGTVFFQLDWGFDTEEMNQKVSDFNGWRDTNEEHEEKVLMAKFTPNFDEKSWKYDALEIMGAEFDWR